MSEVSNKKCAVYGTGKDVKTHIVTIHEEEKLAKPVLWAKRNLSPRAVLRLKKAIKRALQSKKRRSGKSNHSSED